MLFLGFILASLFMFIMPNHAHAFILANPKSPQEILVDTLIVAVVLTGVFSLTSALIEAMFYYVFIGDFVKRFRRYFLTFVIANVTAIVTFIGFQIVINGILTQIPGSLSLTYRPNSIVLFLFNILTIAMFIIPFVCKYIVIRLDFNTLTNKKILSKQISSKALLILFSIGTIISIAIYYFVVFPALNWVL